MARTDTRPTPAALLAYGAPAVPLAALTLPVYVFLPTVYAEELGLGLGAVGAALLIARLWDVLTDPLVGALSDATRGRFGRRRPWIVAGLPLVLAAVWFLFLPDRSAGIAYLIGWSLALYLGWTMMVLPLTAWGAEMSGDYHQRSRIAAFREAGVLLGTLLALALPLMAGLGSAAEKLAALGIIGEVTILALPVAVALLLWRTPERPPAARAGLALRPALRIMARNKPFRRLIVAYLINGTANGLPATLFLLFVSEVLQLPDRAGMFLALYFGAGVLAVPLWLSLSYRYGKHRVWCGAMVWACAVFVFVPLLGPGDLWGYVAVCVLTGSALGADLVLPSAIQADVVDVDTAASGTQRTGLFFALWGMATKLALALAVGLAFPVLDLAGLQEGDGNSPGALFALAALYALVPVIFKLAAVVLMWRFPLTAAAQEELQQRIAQASERAGSAE
jgi:Na+/melibiose symporter-like transporter